VARGEGGGRGSSGRRENLTGSGGKNIDFSNFAAKKGGNIEQRRGSGLLGHLIEWGGGNRSKENGRGAKV